MMPLCTPIPILYTTLGRSYTVEGYALQVNRRTHSDRLELPLPPEDARHRPADAHAIRAEGNQYLPTGVHGRRLLLRHQRYITYR